MLKRTKIVLALPSYHRQRLSSIRRGWCPSRSQKGIEWVIRSDASVAHRLSLSARVVSTVDSQVKRNNKGGSASGACRIGLCRRLQKRIRGKPRRDLCNSPIPILPGYYRGGAPLPIPRSTRQTAPADPEDATGSTRGRNFALNPRHHRHHRRCCRRAYRPPHAAYGSDRPRAFDRPRWRRAAGRASLARSPGRPISR